MVATNAFSVGIDKPDVRIIIPGPARLTGSLLSGSGTGGTETDKGIRGDTHAKSDKTTLNQRIADTFPDKDYIKDVYRHLQYHYQMAMGDGLGCMYDFSLEEFCRKFKYFSRTCRQRTEDIDTGRIRRYR